MAALSRATATAAILGAALAVSGCSVMQGEFTLASFSAPSTAFTDLEDSAPKAAIISEDDRMRTATVAHVPFNVSLWLRRDTERQFMVQRQDLQPMFLTDWSEERAQLAIADAYGADCGVGSLALEQAIWDPVGVWVVDGVCR